MWRVVSLTPPKMRSVAGIVEIAARLSIDEAGSVTIKSIACRTIHGKPIASEDPVFIAAAREALAVLRFTPAHENNIAVPFDDYPLSFGFSTAALETVVDARTIKRSKAVEN